MYPTHMRYHLQKQSLSMHDLKIKNAHCSARKLTSCTLKVFAKNAV